MTTGAPRTPATAPPASLCVACHDLPAEAASAPYCGRCAGELEDFYADLEERERGDQYIDRIVAAEMAYD